MGRPRGWVTRVAVAAASVLVVLGGCAVRVPGEAKRAGAVIDPGKVAGIPVREGPSGVRAGAGPARDVEVENESTSPIDVLARNAVSDVQAYWTQRFPQDFGQPYKQVGRFVSYDSGGPSMVLCRSNTQGLVNAFFCPSEDTIAWDRGQLLPMLSDQFGELAVVTVLAHEIGHAVSQRAGLAKPGTPTIVSEQQADCFTGAFFKHVADGKSPHFVVSTGEGLNNVLQTMFSLRDQVGQSFTKRGAHGNAFDRVSAFQFGFSQGPVRCAAIDVPEIQRRITELPFKAGDTTGGNLTVNSANIIQIVDNLKVVFKDSGAAPPELLDGTISCPDAQATTPAAYCPANNSISLDLARLAEIGAQPQKGMKKGSAIGDFAAYAEVASRYVLSVQKHTGFPLNDTNAGLRTACLVGSWAGALLERPTGGRNPVQGLRISAGDLDEAVAELLSGKSLIAADVNGTHVPSGFARIEAFRIGFMDGASPCVEDFGA
ncbi:putative metalloprotease [Crossiella equi]|uniref:Metalloprotease n=1 Tax=Crossiella equi TaxID=130796 RepID=A0ABS5AKG3_9PSEU|nr:neutral zinc metallopeptidase [Crossiella equi]MBP2476862.1 putative metalloprotease [Crossiella equi]